MPAEAGVVRTRMSFLLLSRVMVGCLVAANVALSGCVEMGASHPATKVEGPATAEDHLVAALMYEKRAQQLELEALKFEEETARITIHEDSKGFRRSALRTAAQSCRKEVSELKDLARQHRQKAEGL